MKRLNASLKFDRSVLDFTIRVFYKHKTLAIMPLFASEVLLCENKKNSVTKCYPSEYWTSDSKTNTPLSGRTWHLLVRLIFYTPYIAILY